MDYKYRLTAESNFDNYEVSDVKVVIETNDEDSYNLVEHLVNLIICLGFSKENIVECMREYLEVEEESLKHDCED